MLPTGPTSFTQMRRLLIPCTPTPPPAMKTFPLATLAALVLSWICQPARAQPSVPHITVTVSVKSTNAFKDIPGSGAKSKEQTRNLLVSLDNRDPQAIQGVSVKWTIYGRKMADNQLIVVKQGTETTHLDALKSGIVKSGEVAIKGTPQHAVTTTKRIKGKPRSSSTEQPASGADYYGYAVKVFVGNVQVEESYSQPGLKDVK